MKRFSNVSAADLINFIDIVVGDDNRKNFDVFIDEHKTEIVVVNRETCEGDGLQAARIHYGA